MLTLTTPFLLRVGANPNPNPNQVHRISRVRAKPNPNPNQVHRISRVRANPNPNPSQVHRISRVSELKTWKSISVDSTAPQSESQGEGPSPGEG